MSEIEWRQDVRNERNKQWLCERPGAVNYFCIRDWEPQGPLCVNAGTEDGGETVVLSPADHALVEALLVTRVNNLRRALEGAEAMHQAFLEEGYYGLVELLAPPKY